MRGYVQMQLSEGYRAFSIPWGPPNSPKQPAQKIFLWKPNNF